MTSLSVFAFGLFCPLLGAGIGINLRRRLPEHHLSRDAIDVIKLAMGLMAGAMFSHLTVLGIAVKGDGGLLFGLAVTVLVAPLIMTAHSHPWGLSFYVPLVGGPYPRTESREWRFRMANRGAGWVIESVTVR